MSLSQQILLDELLAIDEPSFPVIPTDTLERWFSAWWNYAKDCVHLNGGESVAETAFISALSPALLPTPLPITFFLAYEAAMRAAWAALSTPATLVQDAVVAGNYARTGIAITPTLFAPLALPVAAIGLTPGNTKVQPRTYFAGVIHTWTLENLCVASVWTASPNGLVLVPVPTLPFS